jgi:hypothetical protein
MTGRTRWWRAGGSRVELLAWRTTDIGVLLTPRVLRFYPLPKLSDVIAALMTFRIFSRCKSK